MITAGLLVSMAMTGPAAATSGPTTKWHAVASGAFNGRAGGGVVMVNIDKGTGTPADFPPFGMASPETLAAHGHGNGMLEIALKAFKSFAAVGKLVKPVMNPASMSGSAAAVRKVAGRLSGIQEIDLFLPGVANMAAVTSGQYQAYISMQTEAPSGSYQDVADFSVPDAPFVPDISIRRPLTGSVTITRVANGIIEGRFDGRLVPSDALKRIFSRNSPCPGARHWKGGVHRCFTLEVHLAGRFLVPIGDSSTRMAEAAQIMKGMGGPGMQNMLHASGVTPGIASNPAKRAALVKKMQQFAPPGAMSRPAGARPASTSPTSGPHGGHGHLRFGNTERDFKIDSCSFQNVPGMGQQVSVQANTSDLRVMISSASTGPDGKVQTVAIVLGTPPSVKSFQLSRTEQGGTWRSASGRNADGPAVWVDGRHVSVHGTFSETSVGIQREVGGSIEAVCGG